MGFRANLERRSNRTVCGLAWRTYNIQNVILPGNMEHGLQIVLLSQGTLGHKKPEYSMSRDEKKRKPAKGLETAQSAAGTDTTQCRGGKKSQRAWDRNRRIFQDVLGPLTMQIFSRNVSDSAKLYSVSSVQTSFSRVWV